MKNRIALLGCAIICLAGLLVLPVSAAIAHPVSSGNPINQSLRNDLWNVHANHRLSAFENNVTAADDTIAVLDHYNYDTSILGAIQSNISQHHDSLAAALSGKDRDQLRTINAELKGLWKDFGREIHQLIRNNVQTG